MKLETIEVQGSYREMGRSQGETLRPRIHAFVEQRMKAVNGYVDDRGQKFDVDRFMALGKQSMKIHADWDPQSAEEHQGIAEGADIDPLKLFVAANMTDMRDAYLLSASEGQPLKIMSADAEGCSSILLPPNKTQNGHPLVGQTWDLNPPDVAFIVAIKRNPVDAPKTWSVTCGGCLSLMGINEFGVSVGTTNIKTYGSKPGVGYLSILHRALRTQSASEAKEVIKTAPHAGAHTYWFADATTQAEWEASPNGLHLREAEDQAIFRTNHCLFEPHQKIQGELPGESSVARFSRLSDMLSENDFDVDKMRNVFADRSDGDLSVNRYEEDGKGTATNAVFISSPTEKKAWACRGPADRGEWVELTFDS